MLYQVILPKRIKKEYLILDKKTKERIKKLFVVLSNNPYIGKKLSGEYKNQYVVRVWPYRVIYEIISNEKVILIVRIGHRQGIYKN